MQKSKILSQTIYCFTLFMVAACAPTAEKSAVIASPQIEPSAAADGGAPLVMGHTYTLTSKVLGTDRRLTVRVPYGYDMEQTKDKSYPAVYVIDGGPEQDFPHIAGIAQSREVNGTFSSFILVGIETVNRRHQITPPATDVEIYEAELGAKPGGSAQFREFISKDVMPWVNDRYRTNGRDAVMGESLAGLFVIETLFEDPKLFDDYIAVTPSLWWENMKYGKEAAQYLKRLPAGKRRLYITSANEGYRHQEGIDKLIGALKTYAPQDLKWLYFARGDRETHASIYHVAALDAFRTFFPVTTRYGRPGPLLSGKPLPDRTPAQQALLKQECTVPTSLHLTPGVNSGVEQNKNAYKCLVLDYGIAPSAGNMKVLMQAGALKQD